MVMSINVELLSKCRFSGIRATQTIERILRSGTFKGPRGELLPLQAHARQSSICVGFGKTWVMHGTMVDLEGLSRVHFEVPTSTSHGGIVALSASSEQMMMAAVTLGSCIAASAQICHGADEDPIVGVRVFGHGERRLNMQHLSHAFRAGCQLEYLWGRGRNKVKLLLDTPSGVTLLDAFNMCEQGAA